MDAVYYIIIPIITSLIGGLIGGLFTFLGVKMTIKNDNEIKRLDILEKNKERNKEIIKNCPQIKIENNLMDVKYVTDIYVLPYISPTLKTKEGIVFDYNSLNLNKEFWDCKEITIKNIGGKTIETIFLQLPYKSNLNIYSDYEIISWRNKTSFTKFYYNDHVALLRVIQPNEIVKLRIFYHKSYPELQNVWINCYMSDEDDQEGITFVEGYKPISISPDEYLMHHKDDYYKTFIFEHMFYNNEIKSYFNTNETERVLDKTKRSFRRRERKQEKFRLDVQNGEAVLKY